VEFMVPRNVLTDTRNDGIHRILSSLSILRAIRPTKLRAESSLDPDQGVDVPLLSHLATDVEVVLLRHLPSLVLRIRQSLNCKKAFS